MAGPNERVEVVVVGAGLAGLRAATILAAAGADTVVLEAAGEVGGRVRSRRVDGIVVDEGFQVVQPAYPELRACMDLDALDLQPFEPGLGVVAEGRLRVLLDPRRRPSALAGWLTTDLVSWPDRLAVARLLLDVGLPRQPLRPGRWDDRPFPEELERRRVSRRAVARLLQPFLRGVFLDDQLDVSARVAKLVLRSFLDGVPAVPAAGMGALARQLAGRLPPGALRCASPVASVDRHGAVLADGRRVDADAVVVATDPLSATSLVPGLEVPAMRSATTFWHVAPQSPIGRPLLLVDADDRLVASTVDMTAAAPSYAPGAGALMATVVLGVHGAELDGPLRRRLATLLAVGTGDWELLCVTAVPSALPAASAPWPLHQPTRLAEGLWVCGDYRATPSIQGALVSGRRAAVSVATALGRDAGAALEALRPR